MRSAGGALGATWLAGAATVWAPAAPPLQPLMTFNFAVEVEGLLVGGFTRVEGLSGEVVVEDYREGGVNGYVHKLAGRTSFANLELRYGLTGVGMLWDWFAATTEGSIQRRNGTVMLLDQQRVPVMWWNFRNALPVRWSGPTFDASDDAIGIESLELAHEGLTMPLLSRAAAVAHGVAGMAGRGR
jgi:phage tail-like protein